MREDKFRLFRQGISESRFRPYLIGSGGNATDAYSLYAWNVALSESLYPCLNFVEMALRNAIHSAVSTNFRDGYWFLNNLVGKERAIVSGVRRDLQDRGKSPTAPDFVSSLWFGFWVNLFSNRYEGILWPQLLRPIFRVCRGVIALLETFASVLIASVSSAIASSITNQSGIYKTWNNSTNKCWKPSAGLARLCWR